MGIGTIIANVQSFDCRRKDLNTAKVEDTTDPDAF